MSFERLLPNGANWRTRPRADAQQIAPGQDAAFVPADWKARSIIRPQPPAGHSSLVACGERLDSAECVKVQLTAQALPQNVRSEYRTQYPESHGRDHAQSAIPIHE